MWEKIDDFTKRLKVHNGWLVHHTTYLPCGNRGSSAVGLASEDIRLFESKNPYKKTTYIYQLSTTMVFVIDQTHAWIIKESNETNRPS